MNSEKRIVSVGTHSGLIEAEEWLEVQKLLKENHEKFPQIQKSHTALVSGIIRCAECGYPMGVSYGHRNPDGSWALGGFSRLTEPTAFQAVVVRFYRIFFPH